MVKLVASVWASLAVNVMVAAGAHAALISFNDNTFNAADYSVSTFVNDISTTPVAITFGQSAGTGNAAPSWQVKFVQGANSTLDILSSMQGFINNTFQYNPSTQGAILALTFSNDRFVELGATLNPQVTVNSRILVKQGSNFYIDAFLDPQTRQS